MESSSRLKRPLLYALIGSVILAALLGIIVVLRNNWGWFEVRVILTTLVVAVASLCGLACDLSRTPGGRNWLPRSGLLLTLLAAILILVGMWVEIHAIEFWKCTWIVSIFTVATVHVCLLSIAKLPSRFRWVYFISWQIIYGLAALLSAIIVFEFDSQGVWQFVAAHSIVVAAISFVIPILHRIGKMDPNRGDLLMPVDARNVDSIDREIARLQGRITELQRMRSEITGPLPEESLPA
ncbi:hypothetical protein FYK55_20355 [Roseiconus nitratireducens]|uniref:Uncharacterized protein n=1 Tax=Roseiconus nitratireducens TaxID=2605748 RepID=A0A5M6CZS2_9BACT|nr:hypothetical protein [Roseiconus nitratireducens]KAA5540738.1 hypothetical protein FYK55_20355 [Roseiconus nitratireducens]